MMSNLIVFAVLVLGVSYFSYKVGYEDGRQDHKQS